MRGLLFFVLSALSLALQAAPIPDGQIETFNGGIGQWSSAAQCCLSVGSGPGGNYLLYTSSTAATYKAVLYNSNVSSMWNGDYTALTYSGQLAIQAINFGPDSLNLRLGFDNGGHVASVSSQALPADGQWHSLSWPLSFNNFSPAVALNNVVMLRFMSNNDGSFSGDLGHATWGIDSIQVYTSLLTPTPTFSRTATRTISPTRSATPTPTCTPTFSTSPTISATPSVTQTWTESPTQTETPTCTSTFSESVTSTQSPSASATPTATGTATETVTWSATSTRTPTASITQTATPTPTFSASPTPSISPTLAPWVRPENGAEGTGPGALKRGQPLCLAFSAVPPQLSVVIFNVRGERCVRWQDQACADVSALAAGVYYVALSSPGLARVQKLVIRP